MEPCLCGLTSPLHSQHRNTGYGSRLERASRIFRAVATLIFVPLRVHVVAFGIAFPDVGYRTIDIIAPYAAQSNATDDVAEATGIESYGRAHPENTGGTVHMESGPFVSLQYSSDTGSLHTIIDAVPRVRRRAYPVPFEAKMNPTWIPRRYLRSTA